MRLGHLNAIMQFAVHLFGWRRRSIDTEIQIGKGISGLEEGGKC